MRILLYFIITLKKLISKHLKSFTESYKYIKYTLFIKLTTLTIFIDKFLPIYLTHNVPIDVVMSIIYKYKKVSLKNSKMIKIQKGKYMLNCSHYTNTIFYLCPDFPTLHYHCGKCGTILTNKSKLSQALKIRKSKTYKYKQTCSHLTSHLDFYMLQQ
jgi:hypothetical protein